MLRQFIFPSVMFKTQYFAAAIESIPKEDTSKRLAK
jgi:hypothetical protein